MIPSPMRCGRKLVLFFSNNSHLSTLKLDCIRMPTATNICWNVLCHLPSISCLIATNISILPLLHLMILGTHKLLPQLRELIFDGVEPDPGNLFVEAFSTHLLPLGDSWLLEPGVAQLEVLVLTNIYPVGGDDIDVIKDIINSAWPLPEPKVFNFTVDTEDNDNDDNGSEFY